TVHTMTTRSALTTRRSDRHPYQCYAHRMGAGLPCRLHTAVEILLGDLREESFLLRDDFLHVGPERLHRSDLIEIFLAHRGVRRCALGGDVQPAVVDGEDVMEDVLQRLVGRLAVLQEFRSEEHTSELQSR